MKHYNVYLDEEINDIYYELSKILKANIYFENKFCGDFTLNFYKEGIAIFHYAQDQIIKNLEKMFFNYDIDFAYIEKDSKVNLLIFYSKKN